MKGESKKGRKKKEPLNYTLGDIVDKMTILSRKVYFGEEDAYLELKTMVSGLKEMDIDGNFILASIRLAQMNFEIWNLENEIRKGGEGRFSLEEIGKRAIEIRNLNRKRIKYKNEINRISGVNHKEVKVKHHSQPNFTSYTS